MENLVGIDRKKAEKLVIELNVLLADYEVFYQNLRGLHWNIKGREFFELHEKFEELYKDINNFRTLVKKERSILALAADAADEGTVSLMSDYISETEKTLWMLNSYLR